VGAERTELLVRLLTKHQDQLFRYIYALVPNSEDAHDVLQETAVALCRKFHQYDPEKPFLAWAYAFAYLEVHKHRDRSRPGRLPLTRELVERLAREREQHETVLQARLDALEECLRQLPPGDRDAIEARYRGGAGTDELARRSGTSRRTLFRQLDRIRRQLSLCIDRRVGPAESP
jgi:RNA polymerase sigma-70 factor (ECF subfamily)